MDTAATTTTTTSATSPISRHAARPADAGLGLGGQEATFVYRGDDVDRLKIDATGNTGTETPEAQAFVHDAFADLVATATDLYGPPIAGCTTGIRERYGRTTEPH